MWHNAVSIQESDGRCLILKRDEREKVHPEGMGCLGENSNGRSSTS
jgi:hypothetical protein